MGVDVTAVTQSCCLVTRPGAEPFLVELYDLRGVVVGRRNEVPGARRQHVAAADGLA